MQYNLETLGDEKFQQLCQALLVRVFPTTQCLPVGQRDGGRDAFVKRSKTQKAKGLAVFQVKFSRNPASRNERDLIQDVIRTEKEKVLRLIERGAKTYYLITNVSGTSYLDGGSIDKVNKELSEAFGIDAHCWWRDDLERRIDAEASIKWSYPEIIRATDLLQFLCNGADSKESERRVEVLRALMAYQYRFDEKLKFKQIDLHKGIVDMFVDVPASLVLEEDKRRSDELREKASFWLEEDRTISHDYFFELDEAASHRDVSAPGALSMLADADFAHHFPLVVVEGAPGQGKSTITQFLCQVHRMILLNRSDLEKVHSRHRPADVRIPIRIDLRDYAAWISGQDPFSDRTGLPRPQDSADVLESFLATLVSKHTGRSFTVDDFAAVAKTSQLLIVLDGFDEVADVGLRNRIVSEVSDAAARISEDALSVQIVVTSRPATFANSPGFSRNEFQYIELSSLTSTVILEYADRWLDGRDTEPREKRDVVRVLREKLQQPHVRDLARNPMQLAILLNLISVRGASLPDKRTALYDSYIDIFLNREADKSPVVRDHRAVLLKIHRYLAWLLQMEAESRGSGGNISETRLKDVLLEFLADEGHTTELVDSLFQGVVERVFVLVSRVQGTFEFEVQPLREYFAARYLYDTAPYSPPGATVSGTLPDRFVALASNFYWLNVTRFFAGCYSTGELASLRYGLKQVEEDPRFRHISHLPELILTLLQDHVFSDQPLLSEEMTGWLLKEPLLTLALAKRSGFAHDHPLSVPLGRSRDTLVRDMKKVVLAEGPSDRLFVACQTLVSNMEFGELYDFWISLEAEFADADRWMWIGQLMSINERMSVSQFQSVFKRHPELAFRSLMGGVVAHLDATEGAWRAVLEPLFSSRVFIPFRGLETETDIGYFCIAIARVLAIDSRDFHRERIRDASVWGYVSSRHTSMRSENLDHERFVRGGKSLLGEEGMPFIDAVRQALMSPLRTISEDHRIWADIFDGWRHSLGHTNGFWLRALSVAHLYKVRSDVVIDDVDFRMEPVNFAAAVRNAVQEPDRFIQYLSTLQPKGGDLYKFALLSGLSFASFDALVSYHERWAAHLDALPQEVWTKLAYSYGEIPFSRSDKRNSTKRWKSASSTQLQSTRLITLIAMRFDPKAASLFTPPLREYRGEDEVIIDRAMSVLFTNVKAREFDWKSTLEFVRDSYCANKMPIFPIRRRHADSIDIPVEYANVICSDATAYPLELVDLAERVLAQQAGKLAVSLAQASGDGTWFSLPDRQ